MVLNAVVSNYEDSVNEETGEIITVYIVRVQLMTKHIVLVKRYSDFRDLYLSMKDRYSKQIANYKFPNISLFNSNAKFTKIRRLRGFNELLGILIKLQPLPAGLQAFLQVQDVYDVMNKLDAAKIGIEPSQKITSEAGFRDSTLGDVVSQAHNTIDTVGSQRIDGLSSLGTVNHHVSHGSSRHNKSTESKTASSKMGVVDLEGDDEEGDEDEEYLQESMKNVIQEQSAPLLRQCFQIAIPVYTSAVFLNVIDVSKSTIVDMILTCTALGLILAFALIIRFKIRSRKQGATHYSGLPSLTLF